MKLAAHISTSGQTHYCERIVAEHSSNKALIWLNPTRISAFGE